MLRRNPAGRAEIAPSFDDQLILFRYFLHELGVDSLMTLSNTLNCREYEGFDESGNSLFYSYFARVSQIRGTSIPLEKLRRYDDNICRHTRLIGKKRQGVQWKYFQYISLLFTEIYLDRFFSDPEALCNDLNAWLLYLREETPARINFKEYNLEKLSKLAFMCATGSGKTLIMHMNILQFLDYLKKAQRQKTTKLTINKIIVLAPNEGMCIQHLEELDLSSIPASMFNKDLNIGSYKDEVILIDMNKLAEEGKKKTVSVDSFEQNNLVLVDEGHRGLSGDVWYEYRTRLSKEGFVFEYSATFKQALNPNATGNTEKARAERELMEEYGKSIIMDYSYKYFYLDGYGKDYRIYNLQNRVESEHKFVYLVGCLLSFYQQMKVFSVKGIELQDFQIEKPLLVFVGNRVTSPVRRGRPLNTAERELLTDVEEVIVFLDRFVSNRANSVAAIRSILSGTSGLIDSNGTDLFSRSFSALRDQEFMGDVADPVDIFNDILQLVFNTSSGANEPRLRIVSFRQLSGEIGLKIGESDHYFGVINIGDTTTLLKNFVEKGLIVNNDEFISDSLFRKINGADSNINILIGSRKFTEGWNSWRVSIMGLINFAQGEGTQAIQLFGRGVRLKGYERCLKRSSKLDISITHPQYIELLETLTIFGVKAQYMQDFKQYLEQEGTPSNEMIHEFQIPVINRFNEIQDKELRIIRVKDDANFKKQSARIIMDIPDKGFGEYLLKSKTIIDCRSKIQSIDSTTSINYEVALEPQTIPNSILPYLNTQRIYEELQEYKSDRKFYNIIIVKEKLVEILSQHEWYGLLIPKNQLAINSYTKLEAFTDYAVLALKSYMEKFFKFEKERWESSRLEYSVIEADDSNFVDKYTMTYVNQNATDTTSNTIKRFVENYSTKMKDKKSQIDFELVCQDCGLVMINFKSHLYSPLICLVSNSSNTQVTPVALNEGEMCFVNYLKKYVDAHTPELNDKSLYLLRNKSKTGIGFFEAGNFYPDFILWIDTPNTQYISFIDPKGMMHIRPDDPKIEFYKTIKDLEKRLTTDTDKKKIVLNSFIMSATPSSSLQSWWSTLGVDANRQFREARNVYSLDDENCVESMIAKILQ